MLSSSAAPIVAPRDALKTLIPIVPTTKRTFRPADQAAAFLRIYQGGNKPMTAVPLRIQLRNDSDVLVFDRREEVGAATFSTARAADLNVALPLSRLTPGAYLLTIEATPQRTRCAAISGSMSSNASVRTRPRRRCVRLRRGRWRRSRSTLSYRRHFDPAWIWSISTSRCSIGIDGR